MTLTKILIADDMSARAVEILSAQPGLLVEVKTGLKPAELKEALKGASGLIVRSATKATADIIEAATSLKIIGRAGIGVDNIDVKAASRRGIIVMNTPSGNAVTTAEHALFLLCSLARRIPQATQSMREGKWEKKKFQGTELFEKTLGILGLGNIGRIVADRALGLKMKVVGYDPFLSPDAAERLGITLLPIDEVIRTADMITVHTPLTPDTKGLLGTAAFAKMKDGVFIVNCARGGIVDEAALLVALNSGKVAGAALDVFETEPPPADHPLVKHDKVVCTPHLGASTDEAQEKVAIEVAEQFAAFFARGEVKNAVNLPSMTKENKARLEPYLDLAEKLGALAGQLITSARAIDVEIVGEFDDANSKRSIVGSALAGLLGRAMQVPVNLVNARLLAEERGIDVREISRARGSTFTSSIAVKVRGADGGEERFVKGSVFQSGDQTQARLVQIDQFSLEAVLTGQMLLLRNQDRPGVIGAVGTLLGTRNINVSRMQVGLDEAHAEALQLWSIDGSVDADVLERVRQVAGVKTAQLVAL